MDDSLKPNTMNLNMFKNQLTSNNKVMIMLTIVMVLLIIPSPYGLYNLFRFICFIGFGVLSYNYYESKQNRNMTILFLSLAILFQPFFKIELGRTLWIIVDVFSSILLLSTLIIDLSVRKDKPLNKIISTLENMISRFQNKVYSIEVAIDFLDKTRPYLKALKHQEKDSNIELYNSYSTNVVNTSLQHLKWFKECAENMNMTYNDYLIDLNNRKEKEFEELTKNIPDLSQFDMESLRNAFYDSYPLKGTFYVAIQTNPRF